MENKDVIELLRHYRHHLLNQMQVLQGYFSMGKMDQVREKLAAIMDYYNEERKLMNLNAPGFALWIMQFNTREDSIRLAYNIHMENINLQRIDSQLIEYCEAITEWILINGNREQLYEGHIEICSPNEEMIGIQFAIKGRFDTFHAEGALLKDSIMLKKNDNGIICTFQIPLDLTG